MAHDTLPTLPEVGDLIGGRFRIARRLGSGGFGTVYQALQENIGREVALKFLAPSVAKDPINIERFRREALHVSQLHHPNTITLFDYGQTESGLFYMVMELLEGTSLAAEIQQGGALEPSRAAHVYLQVLKSLTEAHQRGLVHRDLKPENIHLCEMFGELDYVKVLDFGVAKMTMLDNSGEDVDEGRLTKAGRIFGTPMYMAPEQACAEPVTQATDVYALGLLLFEIWTGLPPVSGRNRMDVIHKQIRDEVPELTPALEGTPIGDLIRRATRKEPSERYADASEVWHAFSEALRASRIMPAPKIAERGQAEGPAGSPGGPPPLPSAVAARPTAQIELEPAARRADPTDPEASQTDPERSGAAQEYEELELIGRGTEVQELFDLTARALGRAEGRFVFLEGEGGVGKTRIARALQEELLRYNVGTGAGTFRRGSGPLDALREALADYWWVAREPRAEVAEAIGADLAPLGVSEDEIEFLIDFLRPEAGDEAASDPSIFGRLEAVLLRLAELRPLVLTLEDVQHADGATLAFLEWFAVSLKAQPARIAIVLTLQSGERTINPDLERSLRAVIANLGHERVARARIRRLRGRELSVLLDAILPMTARLKERVAWLSQGNPTHAIQIVRYLRSSDALKRSGDQWTLREGSPRHIDLPPDLMDLMALRLDSAVALNPQGHLAECAMWLAVLGIRAPLALLERALFEQLGLDAEASAAVVAELERSGIAHGRVYRGAPTVEFDNSLTREALLHRIASGPRKRAFHRAAAELKRAHYAGASREVPLLEIAEHWRLAGEVERYRDALAEGARRTLSRQDARGAREQFRELLRLLEERGERGPLWGEAILAEADLSWRFGELGAAEDAYKTAVRSGVLGPRERARAERGLGHLYVMLGRYDGALSHFGDALQTAERDADPRGVAKALVGLSTVHLRQGEPAEGDRVRGRLIEMLEVIEEPEVAAKVLAHLAESSKRLGELSEAKAYLERALSTYERGRDRKGESDAMIALATLLMLPDESGPARLERAEALLQKARSIKKALGDRRGIAEVFRALGELARHQADLEGAEQYLRQSLRAHEALGAIFDRGAAANTLAIVLMYRGEYAEAGALFERARVSFERLGDRLAESHVELNQAILAINQLEIDRAEALLRKTRDTKIALGTTWALYDVLNHMALCAMWRGDLARAAELFEHTLGELSEVSADEHKAVARTLLGLVRCFQSRLQLAALELGRAWADAEEMSEPYLTGLCQANAAFYAALTGARPTYEGLLEQVRGAVALYALSPLAWLEIVESMALSARREEPGRWSARLVDTAAQLWADLGFAERRRALLELLEASDA